MRERRRQPRLRLKAGFLVYSLRMAALPVLQDGDPVLRRVAEPVPEHLFGSSELAAILRDMADTLDGQPDGVALAAPQVGIPYRIFIVRHDRMERDEEAAKRMGPTLGVFLNPQIVRSSRKQEEMQEGCLSVRGIYGTTLRHERATVRAQDETGGTFARGAGGILAQAFQHEIDHLDGILFTDHAEELHRPTEEEHAAEHA